MKRLICTLFFCAAVVGSASPMLAQDDDDTAKPAKESATDSDASKPKKKVTGKLNPVMEALSAMDCFNGEPNPKAKFYIYLQSASWCPPCRKEMPKIVEMYPEMSKAKVEIILIGCDRNKEAAQGYLKSFKAPFPGVMANEGKDLPGFVQSRGIPHATFVNSKGQLIDAAFASTGIIERWKEVIKQKPQKKRKKAKDESSDEGNSFE